MRPSVPRIVWVALAASGTVACATGTLEEQAVGGKHGYDAGATDGGSAGTDGAAGAPDAGGDGESGAAEAGPKPCKLDTDCSGALARCDLASGKCVECLPSDDGCAPGSYCAPPGDGGAGNQCVPGCTPTKACPSPATCCAGACVDEATDTANCGACGGACAPPSHAAAACVASTCGLGACDPGYGDCDLSADDGCEAAFDSDPAHCGGCDQACTLANATAACAGGSCAVAACDAGWADCDAVAVDGCEIDTTSDAAHCGDCAIACTGGDVCVKSVCKPPCSPGNVAPLASTSFSGGGTTSPYVLARMNDGVSEAVDCNTFAWITAGTSPGGKWVEYDWPTARTLQSMHMDTGSATAGDACGDVGRTLGGATIQWWNGSGWTTDGSISGQPNDWDYAFSAPVTTTKVRLYDLYVTPGAGQNSNPVVYEWQIIGCQ